MVKEILMPKLGLTMVEGKIIQWFVKEGEFVNVGDKLFEVETDKLTNEIMADTEGILKNILVNEGETAEVKALIGIIAGENDDVTSYETKKDDIQETNNIYIDEKTLDDNIKLKEESNSSYIKATPYAKKLASERNIDLSNVAATGYKSIIVAKDVEKTELDEIKIKITPTARKMAEDKGINLADIYNGTKIKKADILALEENYPQDDEFENEKAGSMRKIIAQRMKNTWAGTPMVTFNMEVDMSAMINLRERLKAVYALEGIKLTYNHIIIKILSKLLVKYRYLNASFDNDTITYHKHVNVGIAVDVEKGLMVPNVKGAEKMSLREIALETEKLIEEARTSKLNPDRLTGGTFTITNLGMLGMESFTPIINKPEVAILGINKIAEKPVVRNKEIVIRPMMNLSLTTDHSLVDGALSAKFLKEIVDIIENPYLLID